MRLGLAIRAFLRVLWDRSCAADVAAVLDRKGLPAAPPPAPRLEAPARPTPVSRGSPRSDAITLLATLQREARFVDIVKEPLGNYTDAQIGAAARDVLRDCGNVLERLFALRPLIQEGEGSERDLPPGYDVGRFRVTGNVHGEPPFRGIVAHHGWEATHCEVPQWSGSAESARVIAPVEVEVK
jgi:hypothetical protein